MVAKLNETIFTLEYSIMETSPKLIGTCVLSQQVSTNAITNGVEAVPTVFQVTENYIIIAMSNGEIQIFDIHGTRKKALSSSQGAVWALAVQGDVLASGGTDNLIEVWDLATGLVATNSGAGKNVYNASASPSQPIQNERLTLSPGIIAITSKRYRDTRQLFALSRSLAIRRGSFQRRAIPRFVSGMMQRATAPAC
jgi:WD40 repeat protein